MPWLAIPVSKSEGWALARPGSGGGVTVKLNGGRQHWGHNQYLCSVRCSAVLGCDPTPT